MARAIDANELLGIERLLDTDVVRQSKTASWLLDQVLHDIQAMPTLIPPNEWVSVEERMPEPTHCVLVYTTDYSIEVDAIGSDGEWMAYEVTHWMPLPEPPDKDNSVPAKTPNEPLTCGLVDRHGMPLRAGDTVAADKFFVYAVRYGSHNVNPDNCAPAYQVGWYLEIMWAYPGFEDSVGHTEPLYDIDGTAARYPAHCADTADGLYNLKLEVCCRSPEGEEDNHG